MSLIDDTLKSEVNTVMLQLFDTFKRAEPLRFYKPTEEEVVIFDEDFNSDLEEYNNPNVTRTAQYEEFYCRIIYPKRENTLENFVAGGANIGAKMEQELGIINIQFKEDAYNYIKDCIRFTFMGDKYQKLTSIRKIGVLDTFYLYQLTLKQVN